MKPAEFSIIMPAYNCADTVAESLDSVLAQSWGDFELIIADDCSQDATADILADYARRDRRIRVLRQQTNQGVAQARNLAIRAATGPLIAFLDTDDLWLPEKLAKQKELFDAGHLVLFSSYVRFGEKMADKTVSARRSATYSDLLKSNFIGNLTGAYHAGKLGKIYQQPVHHEDYLMWLQLIRKAGQATGIQEPLARYRVREDSISAGKFKSAIWTWQLYRRHLQLSLLQSTACFISYAYHGVRKRT